MKATAVELLAGYVVLTAVWVGIGLLITGPLGGSGLARLDQDMATWFVEQRTESLNDWANVGAVLADTLVKIIVTAIIAAIMFAVWRSWREPLMVVLALLLEASAFITATWIVGRNRARRRPARGRRRSAPASRPATWPRPRPTARSPS